MRPIARVAASSANQRLPSDPCTIDVGVAPGLSPAENSVIWPAGVMRPIASALPSVNHKLPSGPDVIPTGVDDGPSPAENSVIDPSGSDAAAGETSSANAHPATTAIRCA